MLWKAEAGWEGRKVGGGRGRSRRVEGGVEEVMDRVDFGRGRGRGQGEK